MNIGLIPQTKKDLSKTTTKKEAVLSKVCYHRGVGIENTLDSISEAILITPFMSEFDVQWRNKTLRLGHPPDHGEDTLEDALKLFRGSEILPKIDLKLTSETFTLGLNNLISQLNGIEHQTAIINISGELSANEYMRAEEHLIRETGTNKLLNIDLERYTGKSEEEILTHLKSLKRMPFSISPDLDSNIEVSINLAKTLGIPDIHFWSWFDRRHTIDFLYEKMILCQENSLEVYFDIKTTNIADDEEASVR